MKVLESIYIMAYRQIKRFVRARSRIAGTIINNILWLLFFGLGWAYTLRGQQFQVLFKGLDYLAFLLPATFATSIFQASFMGGISVIWDKQFGFLKEVLVAPAPRSLTILGRALGDSIVSLLNGLIMLAFGFALTSKLNPAGLPMALAIGFVMAVGFTSMGIAIASTMRSPEGFQLIVATITMPMTLLSGAMFPLNMTPDWMQILALISPLTYAVDLCRYFLTGVSFLNMVYPWLTQEVEMLLLVVTSLALMVIAMRMFEKTTIE